MRRRKVAVSSSQYIASPARASAALVQATAPASARAQPTSGARITTAADVFIEAPRNGFRILGQRAGADPPAAGSARGVSPSIEVPHAELDLRVHLDGEDEAHGHERGEEARAAVGEERQRHADDGEEAERHAEVDDDLHGEEREDADGEDASARLLDLRRGREQR